MVSYSFNGVRMKLDKDTDWDNPIVRIEVQRDAALLASAHGQGARVEIRDHDGKLLDVQPPDSQSDLAKARQHLRNATQNLSAIKRDR